ncbi:hypothetical protein DVR12_14830 [Chitinophaga silvatica]|uniref:DUF4440 domain-containing protein n=1 Tax=Chitinophaga silvatica TaxID=2282649 RepID=A0A3E1Y940_9BACT|nr:hypothetical protein [Chitinophaga silvatica]RFS21922.1 hypothetical protein DVR12_14830 [Chitinophaga silvatica]
MKPTLVRVISYTGILFITSLTLCFVLQNPQSSHLQQLIATENQFARQAAETNIKQAFLSVMDTGAILFSAGQPVKGVDLYRQMGVDTAQHLSWYPSYARVTAAGDLGFTCGPYWYEYTRKDHTKSTGYFFSIWMRDLKGEFRLQLDGGVRHTKDTASLLRMPMADTNLFRSINNNPPAINNTSPQTAFELFNKKINNVPLTAYQLNLSATVLLVRPNYPFLREKESVYKYLMKEDISSVNYKILGGKKAPSGEMYFYYGRIKVHHRSAVPAEEGYFVQIWRNEPEGWKIIAEVYQPE